MRLDTSPEPDAGLRGDRARGVLLATTAAIFVAVTIAVVLGLLRPAYSDLERILLRVAWLVTGVCLVALIRGGNRHVVPVGITLTVVFGIYIVANLGYQALVVGAVPTMMIYAIWLPLYYVFVAMVLPDRIATTSSWIACTIGILLLMGLIATRMPEFHLTVEGNLVLSAILIQPLAIVMLKAMAYYRMHYARVAADAQAHREIALELETALEQARRLHAVSAERERELRSAREQLDATLEAAETGVAMVAQDGHLVLTNRGMREMLASVGVASDTAVGFGEVIDAAADAGARDIGGGTTDEWRIAMRGGVTRAITASEFELADGRSFRCRMRRLPDGSIVVTLEDMTNLRRDREVMERLRRMEALGRLTGGVAHDFNNLLAAILGNLELLSVTESGSEEAARIVERTVQSIERGRALTGQLRSFTRASGDGPSVDRVDVADAVTRMSSLLRTSLGEGIELATDFDAQPLAVAVDEGLLQNALINLAVNARDAMRGRGRFTVRTRARTGPVAGAQRGFGPGRWVELACEDTGEGIEPEHLPRVFEPFFTTKSRENGTGLGLSNVQGFVRGAGGELTVDSELGIGTCVRIILPAAESIPDTDGTPVTPEHVDSVGGSTRRMRTPVPAPVSVLVDRADPAGAAATGRRDEHTTAAVPAHPPGGSGGSATGSATGADAAGPVPARRSGSPAGTQSGGERVLLVEDNDEVRHVASRFLGRLGLEVIAVSTVERALAAFSETPVRFVLSDVMLPDGNGYDLVAQLLDKDPGLKVLMTSGYVDVGERDLPRNVLSLPLLKKPYRLNDLRESLVRMGVGVSANGVAAAR